MRPHTNPGATSVNEKPAVTVFPDSAGEKITIPDTRSLHNVGVETPALAGMHRRIDPQRGPQIGSHAPTLNNLTDIIALRRIHT